MRILLKFLFLLLVVKLAAFDWPVKQAAPIMTFGQKKGTTVNIGLNIIGEKEVLAAQDGEMIFFHNKQRGLPSPLGNYLVLYHEGGVETFYGHLKDFKETDQEVFVTRTAVIGETGFSGSTIGGNLFFAMFDCNENEIVNPILLLYPPLEDKMKPRMNNAMLRIKNQDYSLKNLNGFPSGEAFFYADIVDTFNQGKWEVLPFEISLHLNGMEVSHLKFDSLVNKKNRLVLKNMENTQIRLYNDDGALYCGTINLVSGNQHLYLHIADNGGNEYSKDFYIKVD